MEQFSVKISGLDNCASQQTAIINSLDRISGDIMDVRSTLGFNIGTNLAIKTNLLALAGAVELNEIRVKKMRSTINDVKNTYVKTENRLASDMTIFGMTVNELVDAITNPGLGFVVSALFPGLSTVEYVSEFFHTEDKDELKFWNSKFEHDLIDKTKYDYDKDQKKWIKKDDDDEEKTDGQIGKEIVDSIKFLSAETGVDWSLYHAQVSGEGDLGNYSAKMDFLNAQASAEAYLGAGGFGVGVGASATLLALEAEGQLGSDMLGVHGKVGVDVGKVEAKAEAAFAWLNKDGEFDPNVGIDLSAEAIAAEANAQVGVDVLGTEVNGSVGVNFGIGAHADIGFKDGKLKCDVGASLGLGVSVDLEIDVSGTIDAVVEHADDIKNAAIDVMDTASDFAGDVIDGVGDVLSDAGDAISDFGGWVKGWF